VSRVANPTPFKAVLGEPPKATKVNKKQPPKISLFAIGAAFY
jgi:hypothetical protein